MRVGGAGCQTPLNSGEGAQGIFSDPFVAKMPFFFSCPTSWGGCG